jgi:hypothetical protein
MTPPSTIASDCSADVSETLRAWFKMLPAGQTVVMRPGACYLVNEGIKLKDPQGLTVYGGEFRSDVVPSDQKGQPPSDKGYPIFTVLGGKGVTLESMQIDGANPGGYHPRLAFAGGIEFEGTSDATVRGVTISHTFGDGITLAPLRGGADHNSGTILAPAGPITIDGLTVDGAGRQGVTFASVSGALLTDVIVDDTALDTFDFEADQWNEGASDVTIDGCLASGGALFFANGGAGNAAGTHDITVEDCTMSKLEGGSAILVVHHPGQKGKLRGPFVFQSDRLKCGASAYVGCVQLTGADVTVTSSRLDFPGGSFHEAVYALSGKSIASFTDDIVKGYGQTGHFSHDSRVSLRGGVWFPAERIANNG